MHRIKPATRVAENVRMAVLVAGWFVGLAVTQPYTACADPIAKVRGNLMPIPNGSNSPAVATCTNAGTVAINGDSSDMLLSIWNEGDATLHVTGSISFSGADASQFYVAFQPQPETEIAPGGSASFGLRFDPYSTGTKTATVSIPTDAPAQNPYTFAVTGVAFDGPAPQEHDLSTLGFVKPKVRCNSLGVCTLRTKLAVVNVGSVPLTRGAVKLFLGPDLVPEHGTAVPDVVITKPIKATLPQGPKIYTKKITLKVPVSNPTFTNLIAIVLPPAGVAENNPNDNLAIANVTP